MGWTAGRSDSSASEPTLATQDRTSSARASTEFFMSATSQLRGAEGAWPWESDNETVPDTIPPGPAYCEKVGSDPSSQEVHLSLFAPVLSQSTASDQQFEAIHSTKCS